MRTNHQANVVRVRKAAGRGMAAGLVWVEAYLPFDSGAFAEFSALVKSSGSIEAAAVANPELASKALTPIDSHGEAMLPADLEQLAHGFVANSRKLDVQHNRVPTSDLTLVESFINGPEVASPNFYPGAWVVVFKARPGSQVFLDLEAGKLDAVSFQDVVTKIHVIAKEAA